MPRPRKDARVPTNAQLSELLLQSAAGETSGSNRQRALARSARAAYVDWAEEAADVAEAGRSLTELRTVGPWVSGRIEDWLTRHAEPPPPSPLRAGFTTLAEARRVLARAPEWTAEVRGDLQMHTVFSDGKAPLRLMVEEAGRLGYHHVNITDHSRGLVIANGMDEARLARQGEEIRSLNAELAADGRQIRVLHGIEMNLSPEGEGDMDPDALAELDLVLGAFHSALRRTEDQTERYIMALRNPTIQVLAHPRGRRFNTRLGLQADWPTVIGTAATNHVALEIDAHPDRQDLDIATLKLVADMGGWVSVGSDAHRPEELRFLEFGLAAAVAAGIPRNRVLNFLDREELAAWVEEARSLGAGHATG